MHFRSLSFVAACLLLLGWPLQAVADVLVTVDGVRLNGTMADRQYILETGLLPGALSILVGEGENAELRRFARSRVDHVILETEGGRRVFDGRTNLRPSVDTSRVKARHRQGLGIALVIFGAAMVGMSALNPQGGPEVTVSSSSVDVDESTYNVVNYVGFTLGTMAIVGGAIGLVQASSRAKVVDERVGVLESARSIQIGWTRQF